MIKRFIYGLFFAVLVISLPGQPTHSQVGLNIEVTQFDASNFPDIELELAVTENGKALTDLTASEITVSDADGSTTVEQVQSQPLHLYVVAQLSSDADLLYIQDTMRAYIRDYYQPGESITFYFVNTEAPEPLTFSNSQDMLSQINLLTANPAVNEVYIGLQRIYEDLEQAPPSEEPIAVLVIGSYTSRLATARDYANQLSQLGATVHAVRASERTREADVADFLDIATNGGGLFANNREGILVQAQSAIGDLKTVFDGIAKERTRYSISYTADLEPYQPDRSVTISVRAPNGSQGEVTQDYTINYQNPEVTVIEPSDTTLTRVGSADGTFDINSGIITVQVEFPDGIERPLQMAKLVVKDPNTGRILTGGSNAPQDENTVVDTLTLDWDIQSYVDEGAVEVVLEVSVTDVLDKTGITSEIGVVTVNPVVILDTPTPAPTNTPVPTNTPEPTNTREPTNTPEPTNTLAPTNTPIPTQPAILPGFGSDDTEEQRNVFYGLLGFIAFLMVMIIVLLFVILFFTRTQTGQKVAKQATKAARNAGTAVRNAGTAVLGVGGRSGSSRPSARSGGGAGRVIAVLRVVDGVDDAQFEIATDNFIFGREKVQGCDVAIDNRAVSGRHGTIEREDGVFYLRDTGPDDRGSTNGTELNGAVLEPNEPYELQDGDRIILGGEVELIFEDRTASRPAPRSAPPHRPSERRTGTDPRANRRLGTEHVAPPSNVVMDEDEEESDDVLEGGLDPEDIMPSRAGRSLYDDVPSAREPQNRRDNKPSGGSLFGFGSVDEVDLNDD